MLKDPLETSSIQIEEPIPVRPRSRPAWRPRRLTALEIAEGALLADIGVIFQLLINYLPLGGNFLQLLVPVIFALLVLRRGLYVACMSLCVALFLICLFMGPGGMAFLLLEIGAGLFLGMTMRYRLRHMTIIGLGVVCGALALWTLLLLVLFVTGGPTVFLRNLHRAYAQFTPIIAALFRLLGLGALWHSTLFPWLDAFMQWAFQNWLVLLYLICCTLCIPVVVSVYAITNVLLRRMGYAVRPFPGPRLEQAARRLTFALLAPLSWLLRHLPASVFRRNPSLAQLKRQVRLLNMARLRQRRLRRKGRS